MLDSLQISFLVDKKGFSRWIKGDMDRLYLTVYSMQFLGLEQNPRTGTWYLDSRRIGAARWEVMKTAKSYIDAKTGKAYSSDKQCWFLLNRFVQHVWADDDWADYAAEWSE